MPKLTIINQQYPPEVAATGQIFRAMAEYMASAGWEVAVATGTPYYPGLTERPPRRETVNGADVRRLWNTTFPKKSFLGKLLNLLSFEVSLFFYCLFCLRKDQTVLVATAPPMAVVAVAIGRFFRRYRAIMTVQDLYPDVLAASGLSNPGKATYRALAWLMGRSMRACDRVVTISPEMCDRLETAYGLANVAVIPNLFPERIRVIEDNEAVKREKGFSGKLVVQYSGNFGVAHEYETLLSAVRALSGEPDILFQIAGAGRNYDALRFASDAAGYTNIVFEQYAPADQLERHLGTADLSVVVLSEAFRDCLLPSKYYGILASGRGVLLISGCESDISRDIRRRGVGIAFGHGEGERIAETLRALAASPETLREMGARARALYDERYTMDTVLLAYEALFNEETPE